MSETEVRLVQLRPYEALGTSERLASDIFLPAVTSADYPIRDPEVFRRALRAQTFSQYRQCVTIVALHRARPVGVVVGRGRRSPGHPWSLQWVVVHPGFQGHGIGGRLHDAALTQVTARQAEGRTHESATVACSLYRSRGWVLSPRGRGWIHLSRELSGAGMPAA